MTVDGCALLAKTSTDVPDTLKHRLEVFQLVRNIGARAQSIEQFLKKQAQISKILHAAEERERILDWTSAIKHEQKHLHVRKPRVDGIGEWRLQKGEFRNWRDEQKNVQQSVLGLRNPRPGKNAGPAFSRQCAVRASA